LALLLVAAAAAVRWALPEVLGPTPFLVFYLAWVGAAALGGLGPGLLATAASWLCVDLLFDTTPWQTSFGDPATLGRMVIFLAGGTVVSLVAERTRRGRIFERRQANEVARAKQEWERTFDAVPDLISIIDRQYRILRVNRAMADRLGVPPERCIGLTCYQFVHDLHAPPAACPHMQCLADGRTHTAEIYEEHSNSHFLVTCTPLLDPHGQWMGSVHVARDITARKRAEEELKRSESILTQAGEVAHLGAWEVEFTASGDFNQSPLRWSDEVYRIFGYAPHTLKVSNDVFFRHVHPEDRRRVRDALAQAIAEKRPYQIEHRIMRADGAERIVLEHAEIKFDEQGRPRQMIGAVQDITERRQADQALRESEERLRAIFDHAGVGLAEAADGRFVAVNDRFCRILGYASDELLGRTVHELTAPDDQATSDVLNAQLSKGQTDRIDYEKRYLRRDGTPLWAHVTVSAIHDPEGRHRRAIATVEDINERKLAETALRLSERQFKSTFENAAVGITHVGLDGRFLRFNDRFCEITGYSHEALAARTFQEITHPDDLAVEIRLRQRLQRGEIGHYSLDKRYLRADGAAVWVSVTASVQREDGGSPEYFIAIVEDISQRKQMEETLRESEAGLAAAQRLAHVGSWRWNIAADTAHWSEETFRIFGLARGPLQRHREDFLSRIVPEDRQRVDQALSDALSGARDYDLDYRIRLPDGREKVIHAQAQVWRSSDGRPVLMHGTVQDITERKRVEEALREWNATLETKVSERTAELQQRARQLQRLTLELSETEDRERQRMAEILHDDLQQVLAAAKFHVSLMRNRVKRDSSLEATAGQIDQMLKDAIEKSRSLSHELSPAVLHHGDLAGTLRWLAHQVQAKHGLVVHVHAQGQVHLASDALQGFLYKATQELLFNVVKHAQVQEAGIRLRRRGQCLYLSVSDRGRGFDPRGLQDVTGFGLLNIRERVESLGGRMKIKSAPGQGSRFLIVVPDEQKSEDRRQKAEDGKRAEEGSPSSVLGSPASSHTLRVLLADDHEIVRQGLVSLLSDEDAVEIVGEATNGREAVNLADRLRPDVVIMDVSMPVMSGVEATRQIKSELPQTRIIALSMWEQSEVREKMYRAGAESYVLKTAPSEELLAAIRGLEPDSRSAAGSRE
jgi:PAS domain S-box-containing protein